MQAYRGLGSGDSLVRRLTVRKNVWAYQCDDLKDAPKGEEDTENHLVVCVWVYLRNVREVSREFVVGQVLRREQADGELQKI